jgi:uncharacterized protein YdcH (DUF465 family)
MNDTLAGLERTREQLYKQLQEVGDLRRGTVSVLYRKCGKKNCACAQKGHPGHGPQYLWNATINGKSYAKNLKLGPDMEKYLEEIANHKRFLKLCDEIIEVNERICDMRPAPEMKDDNELAELKKKLHQLFMTKYKKK